VLKIPFFDKFVKDMSPLKGRKPDPDPKQINPYPVPGKSFGS